MDSTTSKDDHNNNNNNNNKHTNHKNNENDNKNNNTNTNNANSSTTPHAHTYISSSESTHTHTQIPTSVSISLALPARQFDLSQLSLSLVHLFRILDTHSILQIIACVLHEKKILFHSTQYSLLFFVCECILALCFPFTWEHAYIPVLPKVCLCIVCACFGDNFNRSNSKSLTAKDISIYLCSIYGCYLAIVGCIRSTCALYCWHSLEFTTQT